MLLLSSTPVPTCVRSSTRTRIAVGVAYRGLRATITLSRLTNMSFSLYQHDIISPSSKGVFSRGIPSVL